VGPRQHNFKLKSTHTVIMVSTPLNIGVFGRADHTTFFSSCDHGVGSSLDKPSQSKKPQIQEQVAGGATTFIRALDPDKNVTSSPH